MGDDDIIYMPKISNVAPPTAKYSSLSTRIYKTFNAAFFPQVTTTKGYEEHIRSFLGKELLYANVTPAKTLHKHDMQWKNEPQEVQLGWAHVQTAKLEAALQRSGQKGTFFYGDVDAVIIRLSSKITITEALAMLDLIPKFHLGLVTTANGFAIRVKKEHELIAQANLDQEYAEIVGKTNAHGTCRA